MKRFVKGGDIVRLRHTELNGFLTVDGSVKAGDTNKAYVRVYRGSDDTEARDSNSLFIVELNRNRLRGDFLRWPSEQAEVEYSPLQSLDILQSEEEK